MNSNLFLPKLEILFVFKVLSWGGQIHTQTKGGWDALPARHIIPQSETWWGLKDICAFQLEGKKVNVCKLVHKQSASYITEAGGGG